LTALHYIITR